MNNTTKTLIVGTGVTALVLLSGCSMKTVEEKRLEKAKKEDKKRYSHLKKNTQRFLKNGFDAFLDDTLLSYQGWGVIFWAGGIEHDLKVVKGEKTSTYPLRYVKYNSPKLIKYKEELSKKLQEYLMVLDNTVGAYKTYMAATNQTKIEQNKTKLDKEVKKCLEYSKKEWKFIK